LLDCDCGVPFAACVSARTVARQFDLEGVVGKALGVTQQQVRGAPESLGACSVTSLVIR
jgi:hypothetical protein